MWNDPIRLSGRQRWWAAAVAVVAGVGLAYTVYEICRERPKVGPGRNADPECPYKLTVEPVSAGQGELVVELEVENVSSRLVGWDGEFSAPIFWRVWVTSDRDAAAQQTWDETKWASVQPVGLVGDHPRRPGGEDAKRRFVALAPGERRKQRIALTGRVRQIETVPGDASPDGHVTTFGEERYVRFRIPSGSVAVSVTACYEVYSEFVTAVGLLPESVGVWIGRTRSNTLRIDWEPNE